MTSTAKMFLCWGSVYEQVDGIAMENHVVDKMNTSHPVDHGHGSAIGFIIE